MTSAGTGISHSEYNRNPTKPVHFLQVSAAVCSLASGSHAHLFARASQIWGLPSQSRLKPKYYNRHFTDEEKRDKLVKVVAPADSGEVKDERDTSGPAPVRSHSPPIRVLRHLR